MKKCLQPRKPALLRVTCLFVLCLLFTAAAPQTIVKQRPSGQEDSAATAFPWADSVLRSLSLEEQIAQLFWIRAYSNRDSAYYAGITQIVCDYNIGGITFFKGTPSSQLALTNFWQSIAKTPLMISIDAEWGPGMRLDSAVSFPKQMTLGAIRDDRLIREMGSCIGSQLCRIGVQVNFAPDVDLNSNPLNPVIGFRSFGEDRELVARKAFEYMAGMQEQGIITTAKHFPGHGDTDKDSHYTLPVVSLDRRNIDSLHLYPFRYLIDKGLDAVMVAHLQVPALDTSRNTPTTLSRPVVTDLLRNELGFKGLIITDALDMKGVTEPDKPGSIEVRALQAGNDILLLSSNIPLAVKKISEAVKEGKIDTNAIRERCLKVLILKEEAGLDRYCPPDPAGLQADLWPSRVSYLNRALYESALTLVKNEDSLLPMLYPLCDNPCSVALCDTARTLFQQRIQSYADVPCFNLASLPTCDEIRSLQQAISPYGMVIVSLHNTRAAAKDNYGVNREVLEFIDSLRLTKKVILVLFGSPYLLANFSDLNNLGAILVANQETPEAEDLAAQMVFGGATATGRLPVTASPLLPLFTGIRIDSLRRLKYTVPEELGIDPRNLLALDSLALLGIREKAYPGCQVIFAKDGKVFYDKTFGTMTYDSKDPVDANDLYDVASLTKIFATTLAVMKLTEDGKIHPDDLLKKHIPHLKGDRKHVTVRQVMAHQAGLLPFINFFEETLKNGKPDPAIYSRARSEKFPWRVADSLYIRKDYPDLILKKIVASKWEKDPKYVYSDLGFYLMMRVAEHAAGMPLDTYLEENFYRPLGLAGTAFHPRERFRIGRIVPTEDDTLFRKQLLRGDVHDPGAAMMGGVCGHAGLFSDANGLAVIMQMWLNGGSYGGQQYLKPETIREFTGTAYPGTANRRGIGFDKPALDPNGPGPTCSEASPESFGHTGFTGTYAWADPRENLIFIFLSNRVYPHAGENKLANMNIRTDMHKVVYEAIRKARK